MRGQQNYTEMHGQQNYTEMHGQQNYTEMHGQQNYTEMHGQQNIKCSNNSFNDEPNSLRISTDAAVKWVPNSKHTNNTPVTQFTLVF
jgi:hypothetical protein